MALRMTLQTVMVLQTLLHDPTQELYGLEIAELTGLAPGTTYPILLRLQNAGWVESWAEDIDPRAEKRPPRRYYKLTADGEVESRRALAATRWNKHSIPIPTQQQGTI